MYVDPPRSRRKSLTMRYLLRRRWASLLPIRLPTCIPTYGLASGRQDRMRFLFVRRTADRAKRIALE